jgi:hypothetical protein
VKQVRVFFFVNEKEAKKTLLVPVGPAGGTPARSGANVFLVLFFQKKNCFLANAFSRLLPLPSPGGLP